MRMGGIRRVEIERRMEVQLQTVRHGKDGWHQKDGDEEQAQTEYANM